MYSSIPIHPLLYEVGLIPTSILLDYCQIIYAYWLLSLPDLYPTKEILPINLRKGDRSLQSRELLEDALMWTQDWRPIL